LQEDRFEEHHQCWEQVDAADLIPDTDVIIPSINMVEVLRHDVWFQDSPTDYSRVLPSPDAAQVNITSAPGLHGNTPASPVMPDDIPTPLTYAEAMQGPHGAEWGKAIGKEYLGLASRGAWEEVPQGRRKAIKGKWVFRVKILPGEEPVFKARFVAKGFTQQYGVDFFETFAPTAKLPTLRVLLDIAAREDMELHSMDVTQAFLQGDLHEEIYVEHPLGFPGAPGTVLQLKKPLYGLKQAPREWHAKLRAALISMGLQPTAADPSLFLGPGRLHVLVYVDDLILATPCPASMETLKSQLLDQFDMTDLGELRHYLGMQIVRDRPSRTVSLHQSAYITALLADYNLTSANPSLTPLAVDHKLTTPVVPSTGPHLPRYPQLVGSLMYAMVCTRPDLAFPISVLARYLAPGRATPDHMAAALRTLRYLNGTHQHALTLGGSSPLVLTGYSDASWSDDQSDRRSTQGYVFTLGSGAISWRSTRSSSVSLSSCEAELYAGTMAAQEARWLSFLLAELGYPQTPLTLYCDNKSTISLAENPVFHNRSKHIELRYYFLRELVQRGHLVLRHVASAVNPADIFTKALDKKLHRWMLLALGLQPLCSSGGVLRMNPKGAISVKSLCCVILNEKTNSPNDPLGHQGNLGDPLDPSQRSLGSPLDRVEAPICIMSCL
jgi:hypothetical protein